MPHVLCEIETLRAVASGHNGYLYAVVDACDDPAIQSLVAHLEDKAVCLYRGESEQSYSDIAPYLIPVDDTILDWLLATVWGTPWGFFAVSRMEMSSMRRHFRRFLTITGPSGKELYFRFYDPRVLRHFAESTHLPAAKSFFSLIDSLYVISEDGEILNISLPDDSEPPSAAQSRILFSQDDLNAIAESRRRIFSSRLQTHLTSQFTELHKAINSRDLEAQIETGIQRAVRYEMSGQRQTAQYIECICLHLGGFTPDRDPISVQNILLDRRVDMDVRLERLVQWAKDEALRRTGVPDGKVH